MLGLSYRQFSARRFVPRCCVCASRCLLHAAPFLLGILQKPRAGTLWRWFCPEPVGTGTIPIGHSCDDTTCHGAAHPPAAFLLGIHVTSSRATELRIRSLRRLWQMAACCDTCRRLAPPGASWRRLAPLGASFAPGAAFFLAALGASWRLLSACFPKKSGVHQKSRRGHCGAHYFFASVVYD